MATLIKSLTSGSQPAPDADALRRWEAARGLRLPKEYRFFLTTYNGGFVYPFYFNSGYPAGHPYYEEYDQFTQLDFLYSWNLFVQNNDYLQPWNQQVFVCIGEATSGLLLLALDGQAPGSVNLWWRNNGAWDSGEEFTTAPVVAQSFRDFLMHTLQEGAVRSSRWDDPDAFAAARTLRFP